MQNRDGIEYQWVCTIVEMFTGFVILFPVRTKDSDWMCEQFMMHVGYKYGIPNLIVADNETEFVRIKEVVEAQGGIMHESAPNHHMEGSGGSTRWDYAWISSKPPYKTTK